MNQQMIYPEECYAIRGAIYVVYRELGGGFRKIIVEIKAVESLTKEHRSQLMNYLRLTGSKLGLLVNFGAYPKAVVEQWAN